MQLNTFKPLWFLLAFAALAITGCASQSRAPLPSFQDGPFCHYEAVDLSAEFDAGRLSACQHEGGNFYTLFFHPEGSPINPSSWYAFAIDARQPTDLNLTLSYVHGQHRYVPKVSRDGGATWQTLGAEPEVDEDTGSATFNITADSGRTLVAAQPLFTFDRYESWMAGLARNSGVKRLRIGTSEEGRAIETVAFGKEDAPVLILMGRQHPPETTGARALEVFAERLLESDTLAVKFRQMFRVEIAPLLNPDGVARGNWRHNTRGVDLNRDWGPFTQAETRAARDWLEGLQDPAVAMDFHSTWRDVLYTQTDDSVGKRTEFAGDLSAALVAELGERAPVRDASHNPDLPTSKTWIYETFGVPAMTYEVGDTTPDEDIVLVARLAAETTMRLLLEETR